MKILLAVCIRMMRIHPIGANYKKIAAMAHVIGMKIAIIAPKIVGIVSIILNVEMVCVTDMKIVATVLKIAVAVHPLVEMAHVSGMKIETLAARIVEGA